MMAVHGERVCLDELRAQTEAHDRTDVEKMRMEEPEGIGGWNPLAYASAELGQQIIISDTNLDATDPTTNYPTGLAHRGMGFTAGTVWDAIDFPDEFTIEINCTLHHILDQVRVITDADYVTPQLRFSVDIGSDTELSDPALDGNEDLDPGDAYISSTTPDGTVRSGVNDDAYMFGPLGDPSPDPAATLPG